MNKKSYDSELIWHKLRVNYSSDFILIYFFLKKSRKIVKIRISKEIIYHSSKVIETWGKNLPRSFCFVYYDIFLVLFIFILFKLGQGWDKISLAPAYPNGFVLKWIKSTDAHSA